MHTDVVANNGRKIKLFSWLPSGDVRFVVVVSHGMAEHVQRYGEFAQTCTQQGGAVYGANHRGHGEDAEKLGHYADENGWQLVQDDLDCVIEQAKANHPAKPVVLLGHSMGSFIAQYYAIKQGGKLDGLILSGSNYQSAFIYQAGKFISKLESKRIGAATQSRLLDWLSFHHFNNKFKPVRTKFDWLSRDSNLVDAYIKDKYCGFLCTPQFWSDFLSGLIEISRPHAFTSIPNNLPIYLFSGDKDPVGLQGKGVIALQEKLIQQGNNRVSLMLYPHGRHEMLNELNRQEVCTNIADWIQNNLLQVHA